MKLIISYYMALILLCISFSCTQRDEKQIESEYLSSVLEQVQITDNTEWVVILPGLGCQGCIQEAEAFMKENIRNLNIFFILNKIESLKMLQYKTGIQLKKQSNIYIDGDNKLNIPTDNSIYPCIIRVKDGIIQQYEFQSPKNSQAFKNLKSRIKTE